MRPPPRKGVFPALRRHAVRLAVCRRVGRHDFGGHVGIWYENHCVRCGLAIDKA